MSALFIYIHRTIPLKTAFKTLWENEKMLVQLDLYIFSFPDHAFLATISKTFPNKYRIYIHVDLDYSIAVCQKYLRRLGELIIFELW